MVYIIRINLCDNIQIKKNNKICFAGDSAPYRVLDA